MQTHETVIGIDLGTTNSVAAYLQDGVPRIIPSEKGHLIIPSVVAFSEGQKLLVGQPAKDQMVTNPRNTIYGFKRLMGREYNSPVVKQMLRRFPFAVVAADDGQCAVRMGGRNYSMHELSAMILAEIRAVAEGMLRTPISKAVITVPAYYTDNQRKAVVEAGRIAGLEVLRIVNEPTAAALAYGYSKDLDKTVLIYDLGGGTFDVSIMEITGEVFEVLASGGDPFLGGLDFDNRIVDYLCSTFFEREGIDLRQDRVVMQRLRNAAENAKCELSWLSEVVMSQPYMATRNGVPVHLQMELSRARINGLTKDLVQRTLDICAQVMTERGIERGEIDEILLVGGQTRMPLVQESIREFFAIPPRKGVHPDEVVAIGAAILADNLMDTRSAMLIDALSMSIGVRLANGQYVMAIPKNTPLPAKRELLLETAQGTPNSLQIDVFQGDSGLPEGNDYLGAFVFGNLSPSTAQISVQFSLNQECLLSITAIDPISGRVEAARTVTKDTPESAKEEETLRSLDRKSFGALIKNLARKQQ